MKIFNTPYYTLSTNILKYEHNPETISVITTYSIDKKYDK
jgi:hypothetical protein